MAATSDTSSARSKPAPLFELKSASMTLVALVPRTADLAALAGALEERFADAPGLFDNDPVAVDLALLRDAAAPIDFPALVALLREHRMLPVAVKNGSPEQMAAAQASGLCEAVEGVSATVRSEPEIVLTEVVREVPVPIAAPGSIIIDRPLRSGQQVYARGGDLVVLAVVNNGAEVIADGNIHVYAPLRGRALAGARGNTAARILTMCMEPQLVSIAGIYRTAENPLPADVLGKPAQIRLDGEKLIVEALKL